MTENELIPDDERGAAIGDSEEIMLSGRLICETEEQANRVHALLPAHTEATRQEEGCLMFEVDRTDDPLVWHVKERFVDQAAFDRHQSRTRASEWGQKTADIKRDYNIFYNN